MPFANTVQTTRYYKSSSNPLSLITSKHLFKIVFSDSTSILAHSAWNPSPPLPLYIMRRRFNLPSRNKHDFVSLSSETDPSGVPKVAQLLGFDRHAFSSASLIALIRIQPLSCASGSPVCSITNSPLTGIPKPPSN